MESPHRRTRFAIPLRRREPIRILHVDATAGASGDMILGALVDLGIPLRRIGDAVSALSLRGVRVTARRTARGGIGARKIDVRVSAMQPERGWSDIRRILTRGRLDPAVRQRALAVFRRLAEAEGRVHRVSPERVHFHEVGAADAIVDVVGACVGIAALRIHRIVVSRMTTGWGTVRCEHGTFPVPAPATALLVHGAPIVGGEAEGERLTPTGAAILTTVADAWGPLPPMRPIAVGYGAGTKEFPGSPNVLRMTLGEADPEATDQPPTADREVVVIETTIDDATPQSLAFASERLFEAGALEVYTVPTHMKKGRCGHQITVLARPNDLDPLSRVIFRETTTLGVRFRRESRIELQRRLDPVRTRYGTARVKVGLLDGGVVQVSPEYEDCAALARRGHVPLDEVRRAALEAHRARTVKPPRSTSRRGNR